MSTARPRISAGYDDKWFRVGFGVIVGAAIWALAFSVSQPSIICLDHMPTPIVPGLGFDAVVHQASWLPFPVPTARCTAAVAATGTAETAFAVSWTGAAITALAMTLIAVSLLSARAATPARNRLE